MNVQKRVKKLMKENGLDHTDELVVLKTTIIYVEGQRDFIKERQNEQSVQK